MTQPTRAQIVAAARSWLGTPYHHQARLRGVGIDCVGLLICVCRELALVDPEFDVHGYSSQADGVTIMRQAKERMVEIGRAAMQVGDVIVTAIHNVPHHFGIVGDYRHGGHSIIHATTAVDTPRVIETRLLFSQTTQFGGAFLLPGMA